MKNLYLIIILSAVLYLTGCSGNKIMSNKLGVQTVDKVVGFKTVSMNREFLLFFPRDYDAEGKASPLMIFLHGAGERGSEIKLVRKHGPPKIVAKDPGFHFILVSPQCKTDRRWYSEDIINLVNEIKDRFNVDSSRIYLTGLSMGGFGTWRTAIDYPDIFAAILPVCGGGEPSKVCAIKDIPVWAFHGAKDNVVPIERSEEMVQALKECGGNPKFTVYPEAAHDSWTETYKNPEIYSWLLKQKKKF